MTELTLNKTQSSALVTPKEDTPKDPMLERIKMLEERVEYCESVARQYEYMYKDLERKIKTLDDRQGNVQAIYDYMLKVGSSLAAKNPHGAVFLNENDDPRRLNDK